MRLIFSILPIVLLLAACQGQTADQPAVQPSNPPPAASEAPEAQPPADTPTPEPPTATPIPPTPIPPTDTPIPPSATPTPPPALPPDPQPVAFLAADGQTREGLFYPADRLGAPVVVFVHWVAGNQADWFEIAPWLQNRGLKNPFTNPAQMPWWDPAWFPPAPQGVSYNVFIFSLRGCQPFSDGCQDIDPQGWYADIQGALRQAVLLEGVDASRIAVIGSSIGADGAADGCAWFETEQPGVCRGSLSLSPGDYLDISYANVIKQMSEAEPPAAAWCLADEDEVAFCRVAGEYPTYQVFEIIEGGHGNMLLSPELEPLPMQLILDFLQATLGE